jgi:hypothetical protein
MKILTLKPGQQIKLDNEDYDKVISFRWHVRAIFRYMQYYDTIVVAYPAGSKKAIHLHRLIMKNPPKDYAVKFRDGDRLNMQKNNLFLTRFCMSAIRKNKKLKQLHKKN